MADRPPPNRPPRRAGVVGRLLLAAACVAVLVVGGATPASADPAKPTNYRSRVLRVEPALPPGVTVRVVGGDGFLELHSTGHEVEVLDQVQDSGGAPRAYLRIRADGTVQLNRSSVGYYVNGSRDGRGSPPARVQRAGVRPSWQTVGHHGRYAWHDHRIHWMSPGRPPSVHGDHGKVAMGGTDGDWVVPLVVDGRATRVTGELVLLAAPSPLPWLLGAVVIAAAAILVGARAPLPVIAAGGLTGGAIGSAVGWAQHLASPATVGGTPLSWALPAAALVAGLVAAAWRPASTRVVAGLAAASLLGGWIVMRWPVLDHAVLPTELPAALDRAGTAVVLGLAVAVATVAVRSGLITPRSAPRPRSGGETS
ncbi:MAG: hypothetical protein JWM05_1427 [Acidimicrobiales bacterium]|nr:hypothetical protein [Acidimicrobiales bacterium]